MTNLSIVCKNNASHLENFNMPYWHMGVPVLYLYSRVKYLGQFLTRSTPLPTMCPNRIIR